MRYLLRLDDCHKYALVLLSLAEGMAIGVGFVW